MLPVLEKWYKQEEINPISLNFITVSNLNWFSSLETEKIYSVNIINNAGCLKECLTLEYVNACSI